MNKMEYVIVDETAFCNEDSDAIKLQNVSLEKYKAIYPITILSLSKFMDYMNDQGYECVLDWDYRFGNIPIKKGLVITSTFEKGYLFKRK